MPAPTRLQRAARLGLTAAASAAFIAPLLTRITLGHAFFLTGRGKLANFDTTVEFFASQNIPLPALNAAFVSRLEYYGGRSEEHTSDSSHSQISYAVFCLKKKNNKMWCVD